MTPERWARIEEVFGEALDTPSGKRAAYLEVACAGDEQLRRDVDRLLAEEQNASFRSPVAAMAAYEMSAGAVIGRYCIETKLGEGGMGAVYRSYDTLLRRPVALKILHAGRLADSESRQRLTREARTASALNHPNIVTIYDIGCENGLDFIAAEYVPGGSLHGLIGRKGLGLKDTLRYGIQIADALAASHAAGIVHRDIKPGNILITETGLVKVADFGLAKEVTPLGPGPDAAVSTAPKTADGMISGTPSYMSPEQAEGKAVDARSDIFSFGSVLYEMLTGQPAFLGDSQISTLAAVLQKEPQPAVDITSGVPANLNRVIVRCLRKDPARRFQHMDEVKAALEEVRLEEESRPVIAVQPSHRRGRKLLTAAVAVLAVLASLIGWRLLWSPQGKPPILTQLTLDTGLTYEPAISPNGSLIAYASDRGGENLDIWVQQVPRGEPLRITWDKGNSHEPSFSPDGGTIAFASDREKAGSRGGGIYLVPTLGGESRKVADQGRRPRFSPDGQWIAYWAGNAHSSGEIYVVPTAGGSPRQVPPQMSGLRSPIWTPDGKHLLFRRYIPSGPDSGPDWWVAPVDGGAPVRAGFFKEWNRANLQFSDMANEGIWPEDWIPGTNEVLFSAKVGDSVNLWKIALSPKNWAVEGRPQRLTFGPGPEIQASSATGGRMVFSSATLNRDIWSLTVDANRGTVLSGLQQLTHGAAQDHSPSLSKDGTKMVFESDRTGRQVVWTKDLLTGKERMLTDTPSPNISPRLSPDGTRVAYALRSNANPLANVNLLPFSGGTPRQIGEGCHAEDWLPDGQGIICRIPLPRGGLSGSALGLLDLRTGEIVTLVQHPKFGIWAPRVSPDGGWILFGTANQDQSGEYVAHLRGRVAIPETEWIPSQNGVWSPDGNRVWSNIGQDGFRCIWTQRLDPKTKRTIGNLQPAYHFHGARRSIGNVGFAPGLSLEADRLVFTLGELTGNIWMAESR